MSDHHRLRRYFARAAKRSLRSSNLKERRATKTTRHSFKLGSDAA
jgi:hypothetical protein